LGVFQWRCRGELEEMEMGFWGLPFGFSDWLYRFDHYGEGGMRPSEAEEWAN